MWKKLVALQFALAAVFVSFEGCWRPITRMLDEIGIHVSTDGDNVDVSFGSDHGHDD